MGRMLVIGRCAVEMHLLSESLPSVGETLYPEKYEMRPGGRGGIAAYVSKLFAHKTSVVTRVGKDGNATRLRHFLYDNGISTGSMFTEVGMQTPLDIYLKSAPFGGAGLLRYNSSPAMTVDDVNHALSEKYDMAIVQYEAVDESHRKGVTNLLSERDVRVFADLSLLDDITSLEGTSGIDTLFISESAAEKLGTGSLVTMEDCLRAAMELSRRIGAYFYIIKLCGRGLFIYDGTYYNLIAPCDAPEKEKGGASDALAAVCASVYLETTDITAASQAAYIADKMIKEDLSVFVPTMNDVVKYARDRMLDTRF
ncbi:MAG: hypothetical protein IJF55_02295 [Clostridia bacterium]|nr:hypothetical protein [Clostridia bacterium]